MIKETEYRNLRKVVHRVFCDDCNIELESSGMVYMTSPAQYPYICPQCLKKYIFRENYPWTEIVGDEVECTPQEEKGLMN